MLTGGGLPEAGGGDSTGVVPGMGGVPAGGGGSTGVVPGTGGIIVSGGVGPHSVTVTVVVTVLSISKKIQSQRVRSEVQVKLDKSLTAREESYSAIHLDGSGVLIVCQPIL